MPDPQDRDAARADRIAELKAEDAARAQYFADMKAKESARSRAYHKAVMALRSAHRADWDRHYQLACEAEGISYKPRPTPEEKAAKEIEALLAKFPNLRDDFGG